MNGVLFVKRFVVGVVEEKLVEVGWWEEREEVWFVRDYLGFG